MGDHFTIDREIVEDDLFLSMSCSAQCLYFALMAHARRNGLLIAPRAICRKVEAPESDIRVLIDSGYLYSTDGQYFITHWSQHCGTAENARARSTPEYRLWRSAVLERDDYTCQDCGATENLHVHHIRGFATHPELRTDVSNGVTLCVDCHHAEHAHRRGDAE